MSELSKVLTDLIDENIKLKDKLKKQEKEHLENTLSLLKLIFPDYKAMRKFKVYQKYRVAGMDICQIPF